DWFQQNFHFPNVQNPNDYLHLLEESLNKLLIIDLSVCKTISLPYFQYIYECFFVQPNDQNKINELIGFIHSFRLDHFDLNQLKLLVLLQADHISTIKELDLISSLYDQVQLRFYSELKRKILDQSLITATISRIMVLLSTIKRLQKSQFHPIHCTLLRWILMNVKSYKDSFLKRISTNSLIDNSDEIIEITESLTTNRKLIL
ncbi:hypothetical protein QR98_0009030, partial [Sarcoptes scabiei]